MTHYTYIIRHYTYIIRHYTYIMTHYTYYHIFVYIPYISNYFYCEVY